VVTAVDRRLEAKQWVVVGHHRRIGAQRHAQAGVEHAAHAVGARVELLGHVAPEGRAHRGQKHRLRGGHGADRGQARKLTGRG
jgi:hypothetical protein